MQNNLILASAREALEQLDYQAFWDQIWAKGAVQAYRWISKSNKWLPKSLNRTNKREREKEALAYGFEHFLTSPSRLEELIVSPSAEKWLELYFMRYFKESSALANKLLIADPELACQVVRHCRIWQNESAIEQILQLNWPLGTAPHLEAWHLLKRKHNHWNTEVSQAIQTCQNYSPETILAITEEILVELMGLEPFGTDNNAREMLYVARGKMGACAKPKAGETYVDASAKEFLRESLLTLYHALDYRTNYEQVFAYSPALKIGVLGECLAFKETRDAYVQWHRDGSEYDCTIPSDASKEKALSWLAGRGWDAERSVIDEHITIDQVLSILLDWKKWAINSVYASSDDTLHVVEANTLYDQHPNIFLTMKAAAAFLEFLTSARPKKAPDKIATQKYDSDPPSFIFALDEEKYARSAPQLADTNVCVLLYGILDARLQKQPSKAVSDRLEEELACRAELAGRTLDRELAAAFEENRFDGDVDILLKDQSGILLIQVKRSHFKLTMEQAYNERTDADVVAPHQLQLAKASLEAKHPELRNANIMMVVVSTSLEGLGLLPEGIVKMSVEQYNEFLEESKGQTLSVAIETYRTQLSENHELSLTTCPEQKWIPLGILDR